MSWINVSYLEIGQTLLQKHERFALDARAIQTDLEQTVTNDCFYLRRKTQSCESLMEEVGEIAFSGKEQIGTMEPRFKTRE
jgi:hypothetical protein